MAGEIQARQSHLRTQQWSRSALQQMQSKEVIGDSQHGFTRGKSCLTNVVTFYDRIIVLRGEGRTTESSAWACAKHQTPSCMIPVSELERHGFHGWATG